MDLQPPALGQEIQVACPSAADCASLTALVGGHVSMRTTSLLIAMKESLRVKTQRVVASRCNQGGRHGVQGAAGEFGRLDVLVNNAGVFPSGPLQDVRPEDFDRVLAINVRAPFIAAQIAAGHMTGGGRIINIGSCLAGRTPFPGITLYALSKIALTGLTKGLARDLGPRGITANVIHPGPIDTDMNPADGPGAHAQSAYTALGHYGEAADIAVTVAHLAGEGGRYITGRLHSSGRRRHRLTLCRSASARSKKPPGIPHPRRPLSRSATERTSNPFELDQVARRLSPHHW